jgi:carotenoid cleavage dioxygenase-like enzyme
MTVFDPQVTDNTFVSLTKLGERHYAMTEAPMSIEFDPSTLATLGYGPKAPGTYATAHPHTDPSSGALLNVATRMGPVNAYRFFLQGSNEKPRVIASKRVAEPAYVHSFAMSRRYFALTEFPFIVNPVRIPLSGKPFIENFRWEPERGTCVHVFERDSGKAVGTFETGAGFAFHHVGAWDEGETLVMEYCDHGTPAIIDAFYLDRLRSTTPPDGRSTEPARLRRVAIDLASGEVASELCSEQGLELPRINEERCYLEPYRFVYGIATSEVAPYGIADMLVKVDNETGDAVRWREDGCYAGEPVFVPDPGRRAEDDGVVLSVVLDAARERSYLLVLDAASWQELARVEAPHVIPHGVHGRFDTSLDA